MTASLNKIFLIGRLGKKPEIKYTPFGTPFVTFPLATSEIYKDKNGNQQKITHWHRIIAWKKQAESVFKYLSKGSLVFIEGSLHTRKWTNKQNQTISITEVIAQKIVFLSYSNPSQYPSTSETKNIDQKKHNDQFNDQFKKYNDTKSETYNNPSTHSNTHTVDNTQKHSQTPSQSQIQTQSQESKNNDQFNDQFKHDPITQTQNKIKLLKSKRQINDQKNDQSKDQNKMTRSRNGYYSLHLDELPF